MLLQAMILTGSFPLTEIYFRWKSTEQPLRIALWFLGSAFGITVAYLFLQLIIFPDSPVKGHFLADHEKAIAALRLHKNNTGIQSRKFKLAQVTSSIRDLYLWVFGISMLTFYFINAALARLVRPLAPVLSGIDKRCFGVFIAISFRYGGSHAFCKLLPASAEPFMVILICE